MRHPEILDALNGQSIATTPSSAPSLSHRPASPVHAAAPALRLQVRWARHLDEVRQAQRLRYQIFAEELGARLNPRMPGVDQDIFDPYCEHLVVRDEDTGMIVGTYRILSPNKARAIGAYNSESEFDLTRLQHLRSRMVEIGRSCVHRDHRNGTTIALLWSGLAAYVRDKGGDYLAGTAIRQDYLETVLKWKADRKSTRLNSSHT